MGIMNFVLGVGSQLGVLSQRFSEMIEKKAVDETYKAVIPILDLIDNALLPILICLLSAATIYGVVLGVNMARADSGEKREEAKKRLVNFLIGAVIIIILLIIVYVLAYYLPQIISAINNTVKDAPDITPGGTGN